MKKKNLYESPESELLLVKQEMNFLDSAGADGEGANGKPGNYSRRMDPYGMDMEDEEDMMY